VNFAESEKYLLALGNEVSAMKLGLENIGKLLTALGNPQNNYLKVQVAGTNGKGSVCAFLDAICISAKIKTGLYTSPHLISITERIKIVGREISEEDFARHASLVRSSAEKLVADGELESVPTFFEQVTAIALNHFSEQKIELAILETGLGGRFDATTAAKSEIAAITRIDYDHQNILGNSLAEIAAEKAAIIHDGSKVVVGEQKEESLGVILDRCANLGIAPMLASKTDAIHKGGNTSGSECVKILGSTTGQETPSLPVGFPPRVPTIFQTPDHRYENVQLSLAGRHQIENAKVAILLAEILQEIFPITADDIVKGLETADHSGRLEFRGRFLFDGAHNIGGAKAFREYLDEFVHQPITMVFGAMRDKDISEIAAILFPKAKNLILTKPDNTRSANPKDLIKFVPVDVDPENVFLSDTVPEAIEKALAVAGPDLICITGSLYLVGEAQNILRSEFTL
jgi:folylpolyglutamate synthase/dihydrofolate synthase